MKKTDILSGFFWLFLSIFVSIHSLKLGLGSLNNPGAGFLFFWGGITLGGFSISVLASAFMAGKRNGSEIQIKVFENVNWKKILSVLLSLTIYAILLEKLGFLISTFLLVAFLLRSIEAKHWYVVIFVALISAFLSYTLFELWLHARLPKGILGI